MRQPSGWFESAVEHLDVALLLVGEDRRVAYANAAAHRLFGLVPGAFPGQGVDRLVAAERRGELRNIEDVLAGGGARRVRSVVRREDGSRVDVTMAIEPCQDEHGWVNAVSVRYELVAASGRTSLPPGRGTNPPARVTQPPPLVRANSLSPARPSMPPPLPRAPAEIAASSRHSEQRLSPARTPSEQEMRLHRIERNLLWLEERLSVPASIAPLDDARERARAMLMLGEARGLVEESLAELKAPATSSSLPAPPKIPKL